MTSITKRRPHAPAGFFGVEAAGLRWLRVDGGVEVAEVADVSDDAITLERIAEAAPTRATAAEFGRRLAVTHDAGADAFGIGPDGWRGDGFIGTAPLRLRPHARWGEFFAAERVMPFAQTAHQQGALSGAGLATITALTERLARGEFDDDAGPARIHGDLWAGNVIFTATAAAVIDPAAHGGHRITDLAMLALFGLPHLEAVFDSYQAATTQLPRGWRELIGLHQLHPLLVHAVLFGGSYGAQAVRIAQRY
ncbi:MAG: fructosamine kinase family protein [Propionibacteriales bacterium]|nr:fructosamine kinase family protein [Propionibacteriales bacterium]